MPNVSSIRRRADRWRCRSSLLPSLLSSFSLSLTPSCQPARPTSTNQRSPYPGKRSTALPPINELRTKSRRQSQRNILRLPIGQRSRVGNAANKIYDSSSPDACLNEADACHNEADARQRQTTRLVFLRIRRLYLSSTYEEIVRTSQERRITDR